MADILGRIVSVNVGQPRQKESGGTPNAPRVYTTAIRKDPMEHAVFVTRTHLEGDRQADVRHHGGPDKAVHLHFTRHLAWLGELAGRRILPGEIGENLTLGAWMPTVPDPDEGSFCLGDVVRAGTALLQVTQPRIPCYKQVDQVGVRDLVGRVVAEGRTGLYLRVLEEGWVQTGDVLVLVQRPYPEWPLPRLLAHIFGPPVGQERGELAGIPELGGEIRRRLGLEIQEEP